jgi:amino-acid N-acetyltransferase
VPRQAKATDRPFPFGSAMLSIHIHPSSGRIYFLAKLLFIYFLAKLLLYICFFIPRCLIVEVRDTSVSVALLDPDPLSIDSMTRDRGFSVGCLKKSLRNHAKKDYVMFAHNCGEHWIAVIIIPKWQKVLYLYSNRGRKTNLSGLKSVIDE